MKKIMIVSNVLAGRGGEESVIREAIHGLSPNFEITLVLLMTEAGRKTKWLKEMQQLVPQVMVVDNEKGRLNRILQVGKAIRTYPQDLVLAFTPRIALTASFFRALFRKKFRVVSWLQFAAQSKYSPREIHTLEHTDGNIVLTRAMSDQLVELGVSERKNVVIGNPIKRQTRRILPSPVGTPTRLLYIARIQFLRDKYLKELLESCSHLIGAWQLDIYGGDDSENQEELQQAQAYAESLKISAHIIWHGYVANPWQLVDYADCLVLTSRSEGFGLVLAEAISFGIPVVSSDCPVGPREIVSKENGFLYPMGEVKQLSAYLQGFINRSYNFDRERLIETVKPFYEDNYFAHFKATLDWIVDTGKAY